MKSTVTSWVAAIYLSYYYKKSRCLMALNKAVRIFQGCELAFQNLLKPRVGGLFPLATDSAGCKEASVRCTPGEAVFL